MKSEEIKKSLVTFRQKLGLSDVVVFYPDDHCIFLGVKKSFLDAVAYFDYDASQQKSLGINDEFKEKLKLFLNLTGNSGLLRELQRGLDLP